MCLPLPPSGESSSSFQIVLALPIPTEFGGGEIFFFLWIEGLAKLCLAFHALLPTREVTAYQEELWET